MPIEFSWRFQTQRSSNNFLASLCSGRLLKGLCVAVSSGQATALHEDVEAPPIARTSQESEAETAKLTLGKLGWSIDN
ncbi:hypothetical protein EV424DRAFT_1549809 [Suillus variegatus]|nr:hypothetical protein EV424DRAFT_1549809 [Suillus variegatus]